MTPPNTQQWLDAAFLDQATAWIGTQLAVSGRRQTGPIEQIHVQPWSTVLRIPTDHGTVYFKANDVSLRHEAAVVAFLSGLQPDLVPAPLAVEADRGWLLMADAGQRLREVIEDERSLDRWLRLLPVYGGLQLDATRSVDDLIALGVPDMRLDGLAARFDALLDEISGLDDVPGEIVHRARQQNIASMAEELGAFGIRETIQHGDLNDGQVYFSDGRPVLLDWGDACVSHPFFSLSVALEGVISWGVDDVEDSVDTDPFRDAYLAVFSERLGMALADLRAATTIALRLGWACRAVNGHMVGDNQSTVRRLQMLLDGRVN